MANQLCKDVIKQKENVIEHVDKTMPANPNILEKGLIYVERGTRTAIDYTKDKFVKNIKEKINPKKEFEPKVKKGNKLTQVMEIVFNTKQKTTTETKHLGLLTAIYDTIKTSFQPFKYTSNYRAQHAFITHRESQAIANNAVVKKLTKIFRGATSNDLQDMVNIVMSGTMVDNYNEGMLMPMKKTIFETFETLYSKEQLEKELENISNEKTVKDYIKKVENISKSYAKAITDFKRTIRGNNKEITALKNNTIELRKAIKKLDNSIDKTNMQEKIDNNEFKQKDLKKDNNRIADVNSEIKRRITINNKNISEPNKKLIYETELYAKSVFQIREHYFGKEYVAMERNGEYPDLDVIGKDSVLGSNPKLFEIYKKRVSAFEEIKGTLVDRAYEVLGEKDARHIADTLNRFPNYYKNVVNDANLASQNAKNGIGIHEGLKFNSIGQYIQRMGTDKDINNNILYIDTIALGQMVQQTIELDFLETIKSFDLNKKALITYQNRIKEKINVVVGRISRGETLKEDEKLIKRLKYVTNSVASLISNNPNIDQNLVNIIGEISDDTIFSEVDGKRMNVFERIDYVLGESVTNLENEFKNNINKNVLTNFYHTLPHFKLAVEYFNGDSEIKPSQSQTMSFLEQFGQSNFEGSHNAYRLYKMLDQKFRFKNMIEQEMNINYREHLENSLEGDLNKDYVITTRNGNPLNYNIGGRTINKISINMLLDIQYANPEALSSEVHSQFMSQMDPEYLNVLFQNQDVMILPNDIGKALIESLTPPNDIGSASRAFNKWLRPLMILSPERILKFNFNTALMSDMYRIMQTNPRVLKNVGESFRMVREYYDSGEVKNKVDPQGKIYDNKEKIWWEFNKLFGGQFENELNIINQKVSSNEWNKLMKQIETIDTDEKFSPRKKAYRMLKAYLNFVGPKTTGREMILRLAYGLETAKELDAGKDITYGAAKKVKVNEMLETGEHFKFIAGVANQNFIAYKEAGRFARRINRSIMPFFLFPEGNLKWHYRLYENYIGDIFGKNVSYQKRMKSSGKVAVSMAIQLGLAQAIWNLMQRALGAPEDEEIPDYLKGEEMPFDTFFEEMGIKTDNYLQFGPVVMNKFNLAQDVMTFIPNFNKDKSLSETSLDYGKRQFGRITPLLKTPFELFMGGDYYSDGNMYPVNPKYTVGENVTRKIANLFGFTKTFQYSFDRIKGMPNAYADTQDNLFGDLMGYSKMMVEYQGNAVLTSDRNTHSRVKTNLYNYLDEIGRPYDPTPRYANDKDRLKNAIKMGLRYNDLEYVDLMVAEYMDYLLDDGKTMNEVQSQIQSLFRGQSLRYMGNLSAVDRALFVQNLSVAEYEQYKKALDYERTMFGKYYALLAK